MNFLSGRESIMGCCGSYGICRFPTDYNWNKNTEKLLSQDIDATVTAAARGNYSFIIGVINSNQQKAGKVLEAKGFTASSWFVRPRDTQNGRGSTTVIRVLTRPVCPKKKLKGVPRSR